MPSQTKSLLAFLFSAASASAGRNRLHAQIASRTQKPALARLLRGLASSEAVQSRRFLMYLRGKIGVGDRYLEQYLEEKTKIIAQHYQEMAERCEAAGTKSRAETFLQFRRVVAIQATLLSRYRDKGEALQNDLYVCQICGYLTTSAPPQNCPICNAVLSKFVKMD